HGFDVDAAVCERPRYAPQPVRQPQGGMCSRSPELIQPRPGALAAPSPKCERVTVREETGGGRERVDVEGRSPPADAALQYRGEGRAPLDLADVGSEKTQLELQATEEAERP